MLLLQFSLRNHASFRDEVTLSLVSSSLKTQVPRDSNWSEHVTKVAAIYGPNASGKSALLDGLRFVRAIVTQSATQWADRPRLPRNPFLLDRTSAREASTFVLDFVADDNVRYEYGFSLTEEAVVEEWLQGYWSAKPTLLFDRKFGNIEVGRKLRGGAAMLQRITGERELVLSRAATAKNKQLQVVASAISDGFDFASYGDQDREQRIRQLTTEIADGSFSADDLVALLRVADIGINHVEVSERELPSELKSLIERLLPLPGEDPSDESRGSENLLDPDGVEKVIAALRRALRFHHIGRDGKAYPLELHTESAGTLTWLGLAVPALERLRSGGALCVDELDASLHPRLAQVIVDMFSDSEVNVNGAQLIFTTHDTHFLDNSNPGRLSPEQIWFTEKNSTGVSDLFSLAEFPTRKEQNYARRYLAGRYGAMPQVLPSHVRGLVGLQDTLPLEVAAP